MKRVLICLLFCISCFLNINKVNAETDLKDIAEKYREVANISPILNGFFKDVNVVDNNIVVNYDFSKINIDYSDTIIFTYKDDVISYEFSDDDASSKDSPYNRAATELNYNRSFISAMLYAICFQKGFTEDEIAYADDHMEFLTLEDNGIYYEEISKSFPNDDNTGSLTVTGVKSFKIDLNNIKIEMKTHDPVKITLEELVERLKKDTNNISDAIKDITTDGKSLIFKISETKEYMGKEEDLNYNIVVNYEDNKLIYRFKDEENARAMSELWLTNDIYKSLFEAISYLNGYSDFDIDYKQDELTMEINGVEFKKTTKNYGGTNPEGGITFGNTDGYSEFTFDLSKFNLEKLDNSNQKEQEEPKPVQNTVYKCTEKDGKYFDKNGNSVSKEAYFTSCGVVENPQTGINISIIILGIMATIGLYFLLKNKSYLRKI